MDKPDKKPKSVKASVTFAILLFMVAIGGAAVIIAFREETAGIEIFTKAHGFWAVYFPSLAAILNSFMKARNAAKEAWRKYQLQMVKSAETAGVKNTIGDKGKAIPGDKSGTSMLSNEYTP